MHEETRVRTGKACEILGVHPNTLRRWADTGMLPFLRMPGGPFGERRFLVADLKAFQKEYSKGVN
jgi:excisionase family DNA binding protein